jgi:hypothetical protein
MAAEFEGDLSAVDIEFLRAEAAKLYDGVNPERWERVRDQDFLSLAEEILGCRCMKNSFVRCPFHGTDSTPSFRIYDNNAWCWGCGLYYDNISLVAKYHDFNNFKALLWCEEFFKLPHMENVAYEVGNEERDLKFSDVRERYIQFAGADVRENKNVELAEGYLGYYFEGKGREDGEQDVMPLLAVLGLDIIADISKKLGLE